MKGAGRFDRRIQFRQAVLTDNGLDVTQAWENVGPVYNADVVQLREDEQQRGGQVQASQVVRFIVRYDPFTASITPRNRLVYDNSEYDIVGKREPPNTRRALLEFTAAARADLL